MIPEIGQMALILALLAALLQSTAPVYGAARDDAAWMSLARPAAFAQMFFVAASFSVLVYLMVVQDFSVRYVAANSNLRLPWEYRVSGVWGAHEGSLLLWILILNFWTAAVALFSRKLPEAFASRVLAVLGMISLGFLLFILFTSNPFERLLPAALDGNDLNPLLQDPGLIFHPPMLYTGYVGFSVAFAFAIAALLGGGIDQQWVRWSRPWTNVAWAFLTLGIALGSWWAYYELGWGGWWFWDPAEHAKIMPWLVGTALIHSQAVTEKRGGFQSWTQLLAIFAFSFSLLGTFLVRSGVLTSVHAFASDPERGIFILAFLGIVVGGSLLLYMLRGSTISGGKPFAPASRETLLLANNVVFVCAAGMVLLGTMYPLIGEAFGLGRISVGPPYFGTLFTLLMAPIALLLPFGPMLDWASGNLRLAARRLLPAAAVAIASATLVALLSPDMPIKAVLGVLAACWVGLGTAAFAVLRWRNRPKGRRFTLEMAGMLFAHFGVALFFAGVLLTESTSIEKDLRMAPGQSVRMGDYEFRFSPVVRVDGPNYSAEEGDIAVYRDGFEVSRLKPQKRQYAEGSRIQTESAIDPGLARDLYIALGEPLDATGAWSVRVYVKPFIRWIWAGALLMALGGFLAASDARLRRAPQAVAP